MASAANCGDQLGPSIYSYEKPPNAEEFPITNKFIDTLRKFHTSSCYGIKAEENRDLAVKAIRKCLPALIGKFFPQNLQDAQQVGDSANVVDFTIDCAMDVLDFYFYYPAHEYMYAPLVFFATAQAVLDVIVNCDEEARIDLPKTIQFYKEIEKYQAFLEAKHNVDFDLYEVVMDRATDFVRRRYFEIVTPISIEEVDNCVKEFFVRHAFNSGEQPNEYALEKATKNLRHMPCRLPERVEVMRADMMPTTMGAAEERWVKQFGEEKQVLRRNFKAIQLIQANNEKRSKNLKGMEQAKKFVITGFLTIQRRENRRRNEFHTILKGIISRYKKGKPTRPSNPEFCMEEEKVYSELDMGEEDLDFMPGPARMAILREALKVPVTQDATQNNAVANLGQHNSILGIGAGPRVKPSREVLRKHLSASMSQNNAIAAEKKRLLQVNASRNNGNNNNNENGGVSEDIEKAAAENAENASRNNDEEGEPAAKASDEPVAKASGEPVAKASGEQEPNKDEYEENEFFPKGYADEGEDYEVPEFYGNSVPEGNRILLDAFWENDELRVCDFLCAARIVRQIVNTKLVPEQENCRKNIGYDFMEIQEEAIYLIYEFIDASLMYQCERLVDPLTMAVGALCAMSQFTGFTYKPTLTQKNDIEGFKNRRIKLGTPMPEENLLEAVCEYMGTYLQKKQEEGAEGVIGGEGDDNGEAAIEAAMKKMLRLLILKEDMLPQYMLARLGNAEDAEDEETRQELHYLQNHEAVVEGELKKQMDILGEEFWFETKNKLDKVIADQRAKAGANQLAVGSAKASNQGSIADIFA